MNATDLYIANSWLVYVLSTAVILHYFQADWWRKPRKWAAMDWLLVGIIVSFAGKLADGIYWHATWNAVSAGTPLGKRMLAEGTFYNLFFRQLPIIAAAVCHLRAAWLVYASAKQKAALAVSALLIGSTIWAVTQAVALGL